MTLDMSLWTGDLNAEPDFEFMCGDWGIAPWIRQWVLVFDLGMMITRGIRVDMVRI